MVSVLTTNTIFGRDNRAPAPEVKDDGSNYPWRMFFDNDQRIVDADTTEELLDYLVPGYIGLEAEDRRKARLDLAVQVQALARATIVAGLDKEAVENLNGWEWDVLTYGDETNTDPYGWGDGTGTLGELDDERVDEWNSDVPLVLIETNYIPHTDVIPPLSIEGDYQEVKNIIWLRPSSEEGLLHSLSRIGYITFGTPAALAREKL